MTKAALTHAEVVAKDTQTAIAAAVNPLPAIQHADQWLLQTYPPPEQILAELFDRGAKCAVIGSSKARKSFMLLQFAIALASGKRTFLRWKIPTARRVLLVNLEINEAHFHRRLVRMAAALGCLPKQLAGLAVMNARGGAPIIRQRITAGLASAEVHAGFLEAARGFDVVIIDPLYKLLDGDENAARDMKPVLGAFDRICEETGAALVFAHHNAKGQAGDRQTIDRGAGSGVLARDFDAAIYLTAHQTEGLQVVQTVARCYAPTADFSIRWNDEQHYFEETFDAPVVRTSANARTPTTMPTDADVLALLGGGPLPVKQFLEDAGDTFELAEKRTRSLMRGLLARDLLRKGPKQGFSGAVLIGTPEQMAEITIPGRHRQE